MKAITTGLLMVMAMVRLWETGISPGRNSGPDRA